MNSVPLEVELRRNSELKKKDIETLRNWWDSQMHLPKIYDSDFALFLHSNYYDVEAAKKNIEYYYFMRMHVPEFFSNRDPIFSPGLRKIFDIVSIIPLPNRTKEGHKVIFVRLIDSDPKKYDFSEATKFLNMVLDVCIYEEGTCEGYLFVFDIVGASIKHSFCLSWMGLKKFFLYFHKGSPVRWKGLHYVNTSSVIDKIQDFVKSIIVKNKIVDSIYFHSNLESMKDVVPQEILPSEMGGSAGRITDLHNLQIKKLESYHQWFKNFDSYVKVDEIARQGKSISAYDMFGDEGDFKNLEVD